MPDLSEVWRKKADEADVSKDAEQLLICKGQTDGACLAGLHG